MFQAEFLRFIAEFYPAVNHSNVVGDEKGYAVECFAEFVKSCLNFEVSLNGKQFENTYVF